MMLFISLFALLLVPFLFQAQIIRTYSEPASDQMYHNLLIRLIKMNRHRPIRKHPNLLNTHIQSYPQLIHWALSFLPVKALAFVSRYFTLFMIAANTGAFLLILTHTETLGFAPLTNAQQLMATALFVSYPYQYNLSNAKNVGLSARGFGLFVCTLVFTALLSYLHTGALFFFLLSVALGVVVLLSSQFSTQAFLFAVPIFGILMRSWQVSIVPLCSLLLFMLLFPRLGFSSIKGQLGHKKLFARFLASRYIFLTRESIWKDILIVIPRQIYHAFLRERWNPLKVCRFILRNSYIRRNSLVILFAEFTVIIAVFAVASISGTESVKTQLLLVASLVTVFLITTFRKARILGEPERYLEYAMPFVATCGAILLGPVTLICLLAWNLFLVIYSMPKKSSAPKIEGIDPDFLQVKKRIKEAGAGARVICTSTEDTKFMLDPGIQQFYYWVNDEKNDIFHFSHVYSTSFEYINPAALPELISFYKLNYLVIPKGHAAKYSIAEIKKANEVTLSFENAKYLLFFIDHTAAGKLVSQGLNAGLV
jgi:hypothetical protein